VKGLLRILAKERLWPLWVVLGLGLLLVPRLGSYGFWEPQEMGIAARALPKSAEVLAIEQAREEAAVKRDIALLKTQAKKSGETSAPTEAAIAAAAKERHEGTRRTTEHPPLNEDLVERGLDNLGHNEFAARLPFVLLALIAGLATFFLGVRVRGPRSGLLAVVILAACPLFIFQARQITSELGALGGGALLLLGALGLCSPNAKSRSPLLYLADALCLFVGSGLSYYNSGFFVGIIAPAGAIAAATGISLFVDTPGRAPETSARARLHLQIAATASVLVFLALAFYFTYNLFDWVDASHSEFSLWGKTLHTDGNYSPLIAGVWKTEGSLKIDFDSLLVQIGLGMFPWICLGPIAVARMSTGGEKGTNPLGARMLFAWAAIAWVVCTITLRKVGAVQFPAVAAIAVAVAVWIDQRIDGRAQCKSNGDGSSDADSVATFAAPLIALFAFFAVIILARDIEAFPEQFLSVHLDAAISKFPAGVSLQKVLLALGALFGALLFAWLFFWTPRAAETKRERTIQRLHKWTFPALVGTSLIISVFLSQVWTPQLSTKLSSRATFGVYRSLQEEGNTLGILGKATDGANFYAKTPFETLTGRTGLITFLKRPERVFALVKASELCPIHKESSKQGFDYYVVDDSNADKIMLSNRMWNQDVPPPPGLKALMQYFLDRNPLAQYIVRDKPSTIQHPLDINFDNKLQLIGFDMPESASRGDEMQVRLYYKVLAPVRRNFQVFLHFDGAGVRFQGDHWPVKKRCGTNHWQPGDYVIDEFTVEAGNKSNAATNYKIWTGLFVGSAGNWENMKAVTGNPDDNNRVAIGTLRLK